MKFSFDVIISLLVVGQDQGNLFDHDLTNVLSMVIQDADGVGILVTSSNPQTHFQKFFSDTFHVRSSQYPYLTFAQIRAASITVVATMIGVSVAWSGTLSDQAVVNSFRAAVSKAAEDNEGIQKALDVEEDGSFDFDDIDELDDLDR